jgi:hypothetical protein
VSTGRPQRAPESLRKAVHRVGASCTGEAAGATGDASTGHAGDGGSGRAAQVIAAEVGDGERNAAASVIVGMLARPGAVPEDARAALMLALAEHLAGRDAPASVCHETAAEWTLALTRGPRDASFAADVIEVWASVRDQSPRPWRTSKARAVARSLWRTADRRLGGEAGADDLGEGPGIAAAPEWVPLPQHPVAPPTPPTPPTASADAPPSADYVINGPTPEQARAAMQATTEALGFVVPPTVYKQVAPAGKAAIDLRKLFVPLGEMYGAREMEADEARRPVRVAKLPPFIDFIRGGADEDRKSVV